MALSPEHLRTRAFRVLRPRNTAEAPNAALVCAFIAAVNHAHQGMESSS